MFFLDRNKERYDWDNNDLGEDAGTAEVNPYPLNKLPAELAGIDLETDNNDTSVVTPELDQYDAESIHAATTNSVFIPGGNNSRSAGVATLVDDNPLGRGEPIDAT